MLHPSDENAIDREDRIPDRNAHGLHTHNHSLPSLSSSVSSITSSTGSLRQSLMIPNHHHPKRHSLQPQHVCHPSVSSAQALGTESCHSTQLRRRSGMQPLVPENSAHGIHPRPASPGRHCVDQSQFTYSTPLSRSPSQQMQPHSDPRRVSFNNQVLVIHASNATDTADTTMDTRPPEPQPSVALPTATPVLPLRPENHTSQIWWDESQLAMELADDDLLDKHTHRNQAVRHLRQKISAILSPSLRSTSFDSSSSSSSLSSPSSLSLQAGHSTPKNKKSSTSPCHASSSNNRFLFFRKLKNLAL